MNAQHPFSRRSRVSRAATAGRLPGGDAHGFDTIVKYGIQLEKQPYIAVLIRLMGKEVLLMMKQRIKRIFFWVLILAALCTGTALADKFADTYTDEPPAEVLLHIHESYADYLMEDYIAINGTSKGDYGFALMAQGGRRVLVGYHDDGDGMAYWLRSGDAVPQGEGYAFFRRHPVGSWISQGNTSAVYDSDLGFDVIRIDKEHEEYWSQSASYHWSDGAFRLCAFMDRDEGFERAYVTDGGVSYYNFTEDRKLGRVSGVVQRNLRYVSFCELPKTHARAEEELSVAPDIPEGGLNAQSIRFTGGRKYEVYLGPGEGYGRSGDGKATVSTNDWIQVFGEENGWIMIQYDISRDHMRIGWIRESALPSNTQVDQLNFSPVAAYTARSVTVTDDPLFSRASVLTLPQGIWVEWLATMGDWAYVESSTGDLIRGFVPVDALTTDVVFHLENHPDTAMQRYPLAGTLTIEPSGGITLSVTASSCTPGGQAAAAFALYDVTTGQRIVTALPDVSGFYGQGIADADVYDLLIVPLDAQGREDLSQAVSVQR